MPTRTRPEASGSGSGSGARPRRSRAGPRRCRRTSSPSASSASRGGRRSRMGQGVRVVGFDHVVLVVADVERSLAWYCGELGLRGERVDDWRRGEVLFPSVRIDDHTLIDLLAGERTGTNADHLCLVIEPTDLVAIA